MSKNPTFALEVNDIIREIGSNWFSTFYKHWTSPYKI
jgi:hypothetical protein